jgi:thiosulfate/3-mercaptopyruvate sulfurtransferase
MTQAFTTLISAEELASRLDHCVVVDCRHDLFQPSKGQADYALAHLPGAFFLSLDHDLAGPKGSGQSGRHPLPDRSTLRGRLESLGLSDSTQLVVYDADTGSFAGRLWWLARWLGHEAVAVLDGGLRAWREAGFPVSSEAPAAPARGSLSDRSALEHPVTVDTLMADQAKRELLVVDARAPERWRGDTEPLDPVGGHIPGAINRPLQLNLRPDARFKPAEVLRQEFLAVLGGRDAEWVVHSCGSGVSACHNLLAMRHAGLAGARLYPGSWSEWCADANRPVARGDSPG